MSEEENEGSFRISLATVIALATLSVGIGAAFYQGLAQVHDRIDEVRNELRGVETELENDNAETYSELRRDIRTTYQELRRDIRALEEKERN